MKRAAFLIVLLAASPALPQSQAPPRKIEVAYTQFTLPNGLHVILHEDHSVPIVTVNTWFHVGSAREKPGRTGFAHLFEHLMFMGSGHVKYGEFDRLLEAAGGTNNASTAEDRTNYYIDVPSNALDLALFLESDRMAFLIDAMSPKTVDAQRDVVDFFKLYYQPSNASLVIAGDIDPAKARAAVEKWFSDVKPCTQKISTT